MAPTYAPGDHVLIFRRILYRVGDVVVFAQGNKNYIKRIAKVAGGLYYLSGDNLVDSVRFGPIEKGKIFGKVIFKY